MAGELRAGSPAEPLRYEHLRHPEVAGSLARSPLVLPVGSVEQHGPHLPLSVDVDLAVGFAAELSRRIGGVLAPAVVYGARSLPHSGGGPAFRGTLRVRAAVLIEYLRDVIASYAAAGARELVVVNGHYENEPFVFEALELCREDGALAGATAVALSWWSVVEDEALRDIFPGAFPGWHAEHAGLCETSLMMHLHPERVVAMDIENPTPPRAGIYLHPADPGALTREGVLSRTTGSSAEAGRRLFAHIADGLEEVARRPHGLRGAARAGAAGRTNRRAEERHG